MKILKKEDVEKIVLWLRQKIPNVKIVNGEVSHEKQNGDYITLKFFDTPSPTHTTVRIEVRIHGKDEKTTYSDLKDLDNLVFTALGNANLPIEINDFVIFNIVPRSSVPNLGTKDRKELLRDYLFYY